jgi:hypothetical protein
MESSASRALLSAALGGLLCASMSTCAATTTTSDSGSPDAPVGLDSGPAPQCDSGIPDAAVVTSSTIVANMTLDSFTSQCQALNGAVEIQPHCGGSNSCRGMSYDTETQTLLQHTCRATNTCAGYSCVICD